LRVPDAGRLYHGVLPQGTTEPDSDVSAASLDAYEGTVGRKVAYVYFSTDWFRSRAFPARTAAWVRERGSVPFIRLIRASRPWNTRAALAGGAFGGQRPLPHVRNPMYLAVLTVVVGQALLLGATSLRWWPGAAPRSDLPREPG